MNTFTPEKAIFENCHGLNGNDMAAILGVNPFKTAYEVYEQKVEGREPLPLAQTLWEPLKDVIANHYAETTGYKLCCTGMVKSKQYPILITQPPRLILFNPLGLEIKAVDEYSKHSWGQDHFPLIPIHDYIQVAHHMLVLGYSLWDVALLIEDKEFRTYTIEQDKTLEALLIEEGLKFWTNHIEKKCPPPVDYTHPHAKELIQRQFNLVAKESILLSKQFLPLVNALKKTHKSFNKYQKLKETLETELLEDLKTMEDARVIDQRHLLKSLITKKNYVASKSEAVTLRLQKGGQHE